MKSLNAAKVRSKNRQVVKAQGVARTTDERSNIVVEPRRRVSPPKRKGVIVSARRLQAETDASLLSGAFNILCGLTLTQADIAALSNLSDSQLLKQLSKGQGGLLANLPQNKAVAVSAFVQRVAVLMQRRNIHQLVGMNHGINAVSSPVSEKPMCVLLAEQTNAQRVALIKSGELISSAELTEKLKISRQALSKAVLAHRIFALDFKNERYYPAFYADMALVRRDLERVNKALGDCSPWDCWHFFNVPRTSLGKISPLDALRNGRVKEVIKAAEGFAMR